MKTIKRSIALVLAMILALAMSVTVFAAPNADQNTFSLTLNKAVEGHTYEAYQILSGDLSADKTTLSNIKWGEGIKAEGQTALGGDVRGMNLSLEVVAQLGFVDVQVAAQEGHDVLVRQVLLIHHGLAGGGGGNLQEGAQILDGLDTRGGNLFEVGDFARVAVDDAGRSLHVGAVVALVAEHDGVLADGGQQHVLVGDLAAHHAAVGGHGHDLGHARAGVDAVVGLVALHVVFLQILLGGVEGVCVLHGELAHADQAATAAGLIAELGLNLIDHEGILGVGIRHVAHEVHGGLLVGHAQHHVGAGAILEAQQLAADGVEAAGLLPQARGHGHREHHFLTVDAIHFLADDPFDLGGDALGDGEQGEDAVAHGLDVAAAHHQRLAGDLAVCGGFLVALGDEISDQHACVSSSKSYALVGNQKKTPLPVRRGEAFLRGTTLLGALAPCNGSARRSFTGYACGFLRELGSPEPILTRRAACSLVRALFGRFRGLSPSMFPFIIAEPRANASEISVEKGKAAMVDIGTCGVV